MKFVPNAVTRVVARQLLVGQKHSPTILLVGGVVGVAASTVLACRATLKLEQVIDQANVDLACAKSLDHQEYSEDDRSKDVAYIYVRSTVRVAKLYAPAIVLGAVSIGMLAGSHNILTKRNAALTAAYAALEKGFNEYRERVVDEFGEDKDREFRYGSETREVVEDTKNGPKVTTVKTVGPNGASIYARMFDQFNKNWNLNWDYNRIFLQCQQNYANDRLNAYGHVFLNEVYDMLGMERTPEGAVVGWVKGNGDSFVDFGIFEKGNPDIRDYFKGRDGVLLDFNVDGLIYDKI